MNGRISNINCTIAIGWEGIYFGSCGDMSRTHVHNAVKELVNGGELPRVLGVYGNELGWRGEAA
jgi:hypothetical protein